ncbi:MAG: hypothetical protein ACI9F9_001727 [Candidatus Paceibacteria bacterium]|jgi:hypothetical protein
MRRVNTLRTRGWALALASAVLAGCDQQIESPSALPRGIHFTDVTESSGIEFETTFGEQPATQILEVKGGGLALIDHDGDGDLDIFVPNGATMSAPTEGPGCRLFENQGNMRFRDATQESNLQLRRWGVGAAVADYDGDGHQDIYVTCYGSNALLHNLGDGTFEDVTQAAQVAGDAWSVAAAFGDLDGDGDLDLYVANYLEFDIEHPPPASSFKGAPVFKGPMGLTPAQDVLYENLGGGRFREVSAASGIRETPASFGLGTAILDFNGDGKQDIYVGNDSDANLLYLGQGGMRFEEVGMRSGLAANLYGSTQATMGIALGDVNGNGFPDVFTSNFSNDTNTLHINQQGRFYDDVTARYGLGMVAFPYVGWGCGLYDFDQDRDEDLIVFNGHVYPSATCELMDAEFNEPPLLYTREDKRFRLLTADQAGPWLSEAHRDRGAAFGDLDDDGDVDMIVLELNGPLRILRNDSQGANWLVIRLEGGGIGSRVELFGEGTTQTRWIYSGASFASASEQAAHFGLGSSTALVKVHVTWPDGKVTRLNDVELNQHLLVKH